MKRPFFVGSTLCLLTAFTFVLARDIATTPYDPCATKIEKDPENAYDSCRLYLEQSPRGDAKHIDAIRQWVANYEKVRPYVQFLQRLTANRNAPWFVYEPDMDIELPQTSEREGPYKIEISRSFGDSNQEALLRKAEAVYSSPDKMVDQVFKSLNYWANEPLQEMAPIWGIRGNDEIQATHLVTARAVRYYYDLTRTVRNNPHLPSGFGAVNTSLKYAAVIRRLDRYSHDKDTFENVYVADLTLEWGFVCGGLCGMGFTRNKLVVLDSKGEVIAMYLDAPANSRSWVS
jgi:hypothetical protein